MTTPVPPAAPFLLADTDAAPAVYPAQRGEIVFVDNAVSDLNFLLSNIAAGMEVHVLDAAGDGLAQMAQILAGRSGIDALHLVTHGTQGTIALGTTSLDAHNMASHGASLAAIGSALGADGDIVLYGCEAGAGAEGAALMAGLAQATGADVAASDDLTGAIARGGDWTLELASGAIESASLGATGALDGYAGLLALGTTFDFTSGVTADATLSDGIYARLASQTIGSDTLSITADQGAIVVMDHTALTRPTTNFDGNVVAADGGGPSTPTLYSISLDTSKTFDLTSLAFLNLEGMDATLVFTTNKGSVTKIVSYVGDGSTNTAGVVDFSSDPQMQGVSSVAVTLEAGGQFYAVMDNIVLSNITAALVATPTTTVSDAAFSPDTGSSATDFITNASSQTISGTLSANLVSGESVEVSYDNGSSWSTAAASVGSSAWSASTTLAGSDVLQARVTNAGGSSAAYTHSYTLDTVAPGAPSAPDMSTGSDSGTSSSDDITDATAPTFTGTADSGSTVTLYDTDGTTALGTGTATAGAWSITSSTLSAGAHTITAKAADAAGNVSASAGLSLTVDATAPTIIFSGVALSNDTGYSSTDRITYTAAQTISATLNGTLAAGDTAWGSVDAGTSWVDITSKVSGTALTWDGVTLLSSSGSLKFKIVDSAGNTGTIIAVSYTLDRTAPSVSASPSMSAGSDLGFSSVDRITSDNTPTFTGPNTSLIKTVVLYDSDGVTELATAVSSTKAYSVTAPSMSEGTRTLYIRSVDLAGNKSVLSGGTTITIDTTAPTLAITSNVAQVKIGETATITFTFTEDPGATFAWNGSSGDIVVTGGTLGAISGTGLTRTATFTPTDGTDGGSASITVASTSYTDTAGNGGGAGATPSLTFDTLAPVAPSTPDLAGDSDAGTSSTDDLSSVTTPTFTGTAESGSTVTLYDTDGTSALGTGVATGGVWSIATSALGAGAHTVTATATDAAGNVSAASSGLSMTVETTAPTLAITSDAAQLKIGQTATITFTFTEDPGSTFAWDGSSGSIVVSGGTLGAISGSGLIRTATFTPTADTNGGNASITVASASYTDTAGNAGGAGGTPSLSFDTLAPNAPSAPDLSAASDSGPSSSDNITNGSTPTFTGTAEAGSTVTLYDTDGSTVLGSGVATAGEWSITSSVLSAGAHTISARASDAAGNASAASAGLSVTVDSSAPTLAITSNVAQLKAGHTATITFTFSEDPGASFTWNGTSGDIVVSGGTLGAISGSGLARTATFTPAADTNGGSASITSAEGAYTDTAGNAGGAGSTPSLSFDTLAPNAPSAPDLSAGSDSGTSSSDNITNGSTPTFTGTTEAGSTVTLYDTDGSTVLGSGVATAGEWSITSSLLSAGAHTISAKAADAAGNASVASSGMSVTIDNTRPTLAITSDVTQLKVGETAAITFTFSEDPGSTFTWNGTAGDVAVSGGTVGAISGSGLTRTATFTPTADATGSASITSAEGSYSDAAGNPGDAGTTPALSFDASAPNAPSAPDLDTGSDSGTSSSDNLTNATTPAFTGTAEAGSTVTLYDSDGATVLGHATATGGNWSITSSALSAGTHTVSAKAIDAAGNASTASSGLAVTIDNARPTLAISSDVTQLRAGETASITFSFSEDPGSTFTSGGLQVSGGTLGPVSGAGLTRSATFTPMSNASGSASISVAGGAFADAAGNLGTAGATSLGFDALAPDAPSTPDLAAGSDNGTSISDNLTNATAPTFTGSAEAGSTVTLYDTDGATLLGSGIATGGSWSITSSALSAGSHTISAKATDAAGNVGTASAGLSVTIDTTRATLAITSDVAQLKIGETASITFSFSEDPGSTFTSGDVIVSGGTLGAISGAGLSRTATFTPAASATGSASIMLAEGAFSDAAGNGGGAGLAPSLRFDTLGPNPPSTPDLASASDSGASSSDNLANESTPTFSGTAEAGSTITLYDSDASTVLGASIATGGVWSITSSLLGAGAHTISARATDAGGNVGAASAGLTVIIDATRPTLAITSDVAQLKAGETATISFTFGEDPGSTFTSGDVFVSGGALGAISGAGLIRTATFTPAAGASGSASISVAEGAFSDAAGNGGSAASMPSLGFDTLAPDAPSTPDLATGSDHGTSGSDNLTNSTTPTFTGTAQAGSTVTLHDADGSVLGTATATSGNWSITSSLLGAGAHTISARATDAAGNVSAGSAGLSVTIDSSVPTLAITSDVAQLKVGETATITFTFSEDPASSFTLDDVQVSGGSLGALSGTGLTRSATFTPMASTDGSSASITVASGAYADAAGNPGGAGRTPSLSFDTLAPNAPSTPDLASGSDSGASSTDNLTSRSSVIFTGTAEAGWTVTLYDTDGSTVLGTGVAAGGSWTIGSSALAEGVHHVTAVAADGFNNISALSPAAVITIDRTAPGLPALDLALDSGSSSNDRVTSDGTVNVSGLAAAASWEYSVDAGATWAAGSGTSFTLSGDGAKSGAVRQTDLAGNVSAASEFGFTLDTAGVSAPAIVIGDTALKSGETALVTIRFASPVAGLDNDDFSVANGTLGTLSTSDNGSTWSGVFTPAADATAAANVITLNNAGVTTIAGTAGTGTTSSNTFAIDTKAPTASIAVANTSLVSGQTSVVTIAFSEPVKELSNADLSADNGALSTLSSNDGGTTWSAILTPAAGVSDGSNVITLSNGALTDAAGNAGLGTTSSNNYLVATAGLSASVVVADTAMLAGKTSLVTITFSQAATGFNSANLAPANGTVGEVASSDGGVTWSTTFTPAAGVADASNAITLNYGSASALSNNYALDTVRPTATITVADSALVAGASTLVTVAFSQAVSGFSGADLVVPNATLGALTSADGGITWSATLTPSAQVSSSSNFIRLQGEGVQNAAGNTGLGTVVSNDYAIAGAGAVLSTVDGVAALTEVVADTTTGLVNQTVTIPVIVATRPDDPASLYGVLADIPLGISAPEGEPQTSLTVSLPTGSGLQVDGATTLLSNAQALTDLIGRIESRTSAGSAVQLEMTGQGSDFLGNLGAQVQLETKTLVPTVQPGTVLTGSIIISGSSGTPPAGASNSTAIGLVIDTTNLPGGSVLQLDNVDFAAIVGSATLRGGGGSNYVVGDAAVQNIMLGAEDDFLWGGAGNDIIGSAGGNDTLDGGADDDIVVGGIGHDTVRGGSGNDMVQGGRSDRGEWQFFLSKAGTLQAQHEMALFAPGVSENVSLVEMNQSAAGLSFLGANQEQLIDLSLLYHAVFQRTPDLAGLAYWAREGVAIKDVASLLLTSSEWTAAGNAALGDTAFLQKLYTNVLGREAGAADLQFWGDKLAGAGDMPPVSRADLLIDIAMSSEHRAVSQSAQGYAIGKGARAQEAGWFAGSGDDRLDGGAGSDTLIGGDGADTVLYSGARSDYKLIMGADGQIKVGDKASNDLDLLSSIEAGAFKDGTVDLTWLQGSSASVHKVGLMYQAVLDRPGDIAGFQWWLSLGLDGAQLAQAFTETAEFQGRYGAMNDAAFVRALFDNSELDSAAGGMRVWEDYLANHTRAELVGAWVNVDGVIAAQFGTQGLWLI